MRAVWPRTRPIHSKAHKASECLRSMHILPSPPLPPLVTALQERPFLTLAYCWDEGEQARRAARMTTFHSARHRGFDRLQGQTGKKRQDREALKKSPRGRGKQPTRAVSRTLYAHTYRPDEATSNKTRHRHGSQPRTRWSVNLSLVSRVTARRYAWCFSVFFFHNPGSLAFCLYGYGCLLECIVSILRNIVYYF